MSEDTSTTETEQAEQPQEGADQQGTTEAKTFDADYVKKLREESAKYRTEAKANAEAAKRLAEIEEANQSEAEKQAKRLAEAEERAKALETKAHRAEVASDTGVPVNILAGPEDGSPEALRAFADLVLAHMERATGPRSPKPDPTQGRSGGGPKSTADSFAEFFQNQI